MFGRSKVAEKKSPDEAVSEVVGVQVDNAIKKELRVHWSRMIEHPEECLWLAGPPMYGRYQKTPEFITCTRNYTLNCQGIQSLYALGKFGEDAIIDQGKFTSWIESVNMRDVVAGVLQGLVDNGRLATFDTNIKISGYDFRKGTEVSFQIIYSVTPAADAEVEELGKSILKHVIGVLGKEKEKPCTFHMSSANAESKGNEEHVTIIWRTEPFTGNFVSDRDVINFLTKTVDIHSVTESFVVATRHARMKNFKCDVSYNKDDPCKVDVIISFAYVRS